MTPWAAPLSYYVYPRHGIRCILVRGPPRVRYIPGPGLPNSIHPGSSLPSPVFVPRCKSFISAYDPSNSAQRSGRIQNGNRARPARPPRAEWHPSILRSGTFQLGVLPTVATVSTWLCIRPSGSSFCCNLAWISSMLVESNFSSVILERRRILEETMRWDEMMNWFDGVKYYRIL